MRDNLAASDASHALPLHNAAPLAVHLHVGAVFFAVGCTVLQLAAGLLLAFAFRTNYHLRPAASYASAIVIVLAANVASLFALLVWIRMHAVL